MARLQNSDEPRILTLGGGGGAGIFSALEWIVKVLVRHRAIVSYASSDTGEQINYGRASLGFGHPYLRHSTEK